MIPKTIHYIWLGGRPKSKLTEVCINTWKRNLPNYRIIEWNESNIDLESLCNENRFLKKCVELKLWAFVSDYLRLWILENQGGIYLDTDVEVLKPFDPLLDQHMVFVSLQRLERKKIKEINCLQNFYFLISFQQHWHLLDTSGWWLLMGALMENGFFMRLAA